MQTYQVFLLVLIFFVILYSLVFSGRYSTDDEHILSAQSLSMAFDPQFSFSRVFGNERVFSYTRFGDPYADQALNIEPALAFFGSLIARAAAALSVGRVQALFLINIWITAITAAVIFLSVIRMGYSHVCAIVVAAFFGMGTIVFPYTRTYFRDPLAMMFLACAWYFLIAFEKDLFDPQLRRGIFVHAACLVISLAAGILSKNIILVAVPVILLKLLLDFRKRKLIFGAKKNNKPVWWVWPLAAALVLVFLGWAWIVPDFPLLARFTPRYYSVLIDFFFNTPRPHFIEAVFGPFISPGKSIFLFSPVLLLAVWGLIFRFKEAWPAWSYLILAIIAQAFFYDFEWSGHINWGIRYLLPTIPLLLLTAVPIIDKLLNSRPGKIILILMGVISLFVQVLGIAVPVKDYYTAMYNALQPVTEWSTIWQARYSIFVWDAKQFFSGQPPNLALFRMPEVVIPILLFALGLLGCAFLFAKLEILRPYIWFVLVGCLGFNLLMLGRFKYDPEYNPDRMDLRESLQYLSENVQPGDKVLVRSYGTAAWNYWMNWAPPNITWTSLPYYFPAPSLIEKYRRTQDPADGLYVSSLTILTESVLTDKSVWLLLPSDAPGTDLELEKSWLFARAVDMDCQAFTGEGEKTEVCRFSFQQAR